MLHAFKKIIHVISLTADTHLKQFLIRFVTAFYKIIQAFLKRFVHCMKKIFTLACFFAFGLISCGKVKNAAFH